MNLKEFYSHIKQKINISEIVKKRVNLTYKSGEYIGLCPFHQEKTPSFTVTDVKKFFHCFGCKITGDVINFVSSIQNMPYREAALLIAHEHGIAVPRFNKEDERLYSEEEDILRILSEANKFFQAQLSQEVTNYLLSRGINAGMIKEFEIGFSPSGNRLVSNFNKQNILIDLVAKSGLISKRDDGSLYEIFHNRITFPIKNKYNKVIGFGGRVLDKKLPKYLNSSENLVFKKNQVLYGINQAISEIYKKNFAILVEGYLDVITLHQNGFKTAVASMGTAVNKNQLLELWNYCDDIIVCLDGDVAGQTASKKIIETAIGLVNEQKTVSFISLPAGMDPQDFLISEGSQAFSRMLNAKQSFANMIWIVESNSISLVTPEDKAKLTLKLNNYTNQINNKTLKYNYNKFFKEKLWKINYKKENSSNSSEIISALNKKTFNRSDKEMLEFSMIGLLLKNPRILEHNFIKEFYEMHDFNNDSLSQLNGVILSEFLQNNEITKEIIEKIVKNTSFYEAYTLSLAYSDLSTNSSNKIKDHVLEWDILKTRYYLCLLQEEYQNVANANEVSCNLKKANSYRQEIIKTNEKLRQITENLFN